MPGLQPTAMEEPEAAGQPVGPDGDGSTASPEEQAIYEQVVKNAYEMIEDGGAGHKRYVELMKRLKLSVDQGNPVEGLSSIVAHIVVPLFMSANKKGMNIPGDIMLSAGEEITERLADDAKELKIHTFTPEQIEQSYLAAVDKVRAKLQEAGMLDEAAVKSDLEELKANDGNLEAMAPGLSAWAQKEAGQPQGEK